MAFEAYLYIDGVNGDSTSKIGKNPNGIRVKTSTTPLEIKTYGLNIEMPMVENRSATGAVTVGRANFADFETSKSLDTSTASLLFFCLSGKHISQIVLAVYRRTGEEDQGSKPTLFMQAIFKNAVITEVTVSGSGDEIPSEAFKFNYADVQYVYHKSDPKKGTEGGSTDFTWHRIENAGDKN